MVFLADRAGQSLSASARVLVSNRVKAALSRRGHIKRFAEFGNFHFTRFPAKSNTVAYRLGNAMLRSPGSFASVLREPLLSIAFLKIGTCQWLRAE
jgi:hypothetical protein